MKKVLSLLLAFSLLFLAACSHSPITSQAPGGQANKGLKIVTTIFPYYDFARAIVGDTANLTMLLKPGNEAHSYDPSPADIVAIENADVFIYTGGVDDAWAENLLQTMENKKLTVLRMLDTVPLLEEETVEGMQSEEYGHFELFSDTASGSEWDEHIWTSPKNAALMVEAIGNALQQKDAPHAGVYAQNTQSYLTQINQLDEEFAQIIATSKRKLMVFGDRFPFLYFTREYGLSYRAAFPGCSADSNPSAGTIAYLVDTVKQNSLPYIYDIELSNGSIAAAIAEETGAGILTMQSCQSITLQNFEAGETYVSLMKENATNLVKGLN